MPLLATRVLGLCNQYKLIRGSERIWAGFIGICAAAGGQKTRGTLAHSLSVVGGRGMSCFLK